MKSKLSLRLGRLLLINAGVLCILVVLVEGLSSLVLFIPAAASIRGNVATWDHTLYDPGLGWVSAPNIFVPNMYGPGMDLRTNSQGFRHNQVVHDTILPTQGSRRIICSGDSFTFGYGVGNDHTWCRRLNSIDPCLETVNLGQGGYGVDQAYLRYQRDAARMEHDIHLFAFITDDFNRMMLDSFHGYGKPLLRLQDGALKITNVPVPRRHRYVPLLVEISRHLAQLRTWELVSRVSAKLRGASGELQRQWPGGKEQHTQTILAKVFEDLNRITEQRSSKLVLVYLPTPWDYYPNNTSQAWTDFVERQARQLDIPLISILAEHRKLPASEAARLFGEHRHLSVDGNQYAAMIVHRSLMTFFADLISGREGQCGLPKGRG